MLSLKGCPFFKGYSLEKHKFTDFTRECLSLVFKVMSLPSSFYRTITALPRALIFYFVLWGIVPFTLMKVNFVYQNNVAKRPQLFDQPCILPLIDQT